MPSKREQLRRERYNQLRAMGFNRKEATRYRDTTFFTRRETQSYTVQERVRLYSLGKEYRKAAISLGPTHAESKLLPTERKIEAWREFSGNKSPDQKDFENAANVIRDLLIKSGVSPEYAEREKYRFLNKWYVQRGFSISELGFAGNTFAAEEIYAGDQTVSDFDETDDFVPA